MASLSSLKTKSESLLTDLLIDFSNLCQGLQQSDSIHSFLDLEPYMMPWVDVNETAKAVYRQYLAIRICMPLHAVEQGKSVLSAYA